MFSSKIKISAEATKLCGQSHILEWFSKSSAWMNAHDFISVLIMVSVQTDPKKIKWYKAVH